jgi:metallophosphoesterase superfamily enzyme
MKKFVATYDLHWGYERRNGHKIPLHDLKAWKSVLKFAEDFKPDTWIMGGDILDCGVVSHHNHGKPGATEGLKLISDAREAREEIIEPVEAILGPKGEKVYIVGNHEDWLTDLTDAIPALEGLVDLKSILKLDDKWKIVNQGEAFKLGKLTFIHGDTVKGGEYCAKAAVVNYERSIRFGHHHTYQVYAKSTPFEYKEAKTGMAIPCLCSKTPKYGEGNPNRWMQGFLYGYILDGGNFSDSVVIILDGQCVVNGKIYRG